MQWGGEVPHPKARASSLPLHRIPLLRQCSPHSGSPTVSPAPPQDGIL